MHQGFAVICSLDKVRAPEPAILTPADRVQPQVSSLSGERVQVTALFYDIVGSVELLSRLDPEEFATIQRSFHQDAAAAIRKFGGRIDQIHGDGGCAYFGLPNPLEDAAEYAVSAGLEIVKRCRSLQGDRGFSLMVRVGIATGTVVVAAMQETGLPGQEEVIGIAPALAARIQNEGEPNSVLVAESTYRLAKGAFEFTAVGARQLKGFADPVPLWQPLRRQQGLDRFTTSRRVAAPLIGRDDELEQCRQGWTRARSGQGQFLILHGEAGIGKSRLIAELRNELTEQGIDIALFQCQSRENSRPLHPFLDALERDLAAQGGAGIEAADVRGYFDAQGLSLSDTDAEAIAFLCGHRADDAAEGSWSSGLSAEEIRVRGQDAMLHILAGGPLPRVLVIEDLHWADSLTQSVVEQLPAVVRTLPILVLITARDGGGVTNLAGRNVSSLALSRLGIDATSRMIESIWEDDTPPRGLANFIHERSDGVPLFAEQLACLLREATLKEGGRELTPAEWQKALPPGPVLTLQDLVAARLAGLGPLRRLAQVASVIGREFNLDLLAQIMEAERLPFQLDLAVRKLVRAGILATVATNEGLNSRFQHVLIQEAAYDSLLKADRRQLHTRIIELVSSGSVPPLSDELIAWHFKQADRPMESATYAIRAATSCIARSAMQEADRLLDLAQGQLDSCDATLDPVQDLRLELLAARGPVAAALFGRGSPQASAVYEQGVALCSATTGRDRAKWLPLYWGWWFTAPNYEAQKARAEIIVHDLEETNDPEVRLQSFHCAWASNFEAGRHAYCLSCVEAGLALYDEERARLSRIKYGGHDAKVCGLGERALSLWFTGDDAGSARAIEETLDWAERTGHPDSIFHALDYAVGLARYRNDYLGVIFLSDRMAAIAEERALPGGRAKAKLFGGWARALHGDPDQGSAHFGEGFAVQVEIGTEENLPIYRDMKAEILAHVGRHEEALAILQEAIDASDRNGQVFWLPELYRRRGLLRLELGGSMDDVRTDLEHAIAIAEGHDAAALVARARADMERLGLAPRQPSP